MKKIIKQVQITEYILSEKEVKLVKVCLDYIYHRLEKHESCGIRGVINRDDLNKLRNELI